MSTSYAVFCSKKKTESATATVARARPSVTLPVTLRRLPPSPTLFPYTTLFRSLYGLPRKFNIAFDSGGAISAAADTNDIGFFAVRVTEKSLAAAPSPRSEEHTSELQSHVNLVCRLLLEKKNGVSDSNGGPSQTIGYITCYTEATTP